MKADFFCTECGAHLQVEEQYRGQTIACPNCNKSQVVPGTPPPEPNEFAGADPADTVSGSAAARDAASGNVPGSASSFADSAASDSNSFAPIDSFAADSAGNDTDPTSTNPYQTPKSFASEMSQTVPDGEEYGMVRTPLRARELIRNVFGLIRHHFKRISLLIGGLLLVQLALFGVMMAVDGGQPHALGQPFPTSGETKLLLSLAMVNMFVIGIFTFLFMHYMLFLALGSGGSFYYLFPHSGVVCLRWFLASIVYLLILFGLYILCALATSVVLGLIIGLFAALQSQFSDAVQGIFAIVQVLAIAIVVVTFVILYLSLVFRYIFFFAFIFEKNVPVMKSFSLSSRYTQGNFMKFALAGLVVMIIPILLQLTMFTVALFTNEFDAMNSNAFEMMNANMLSGGGQIVYTILEYVYLFVTIPLSTSLTCVAYAIMTGRAGSSAPAEESQELA